MLLSEILPSVSHLRCTGPVDRRVLGVTRDSREAQEADVAFVAVKGASVDGHRFVRDVASGVVFVENLQVRAREDVTVVTVGCTKLALAQVAATLAGNPSRDLPVIGVTGTNGKTTVTHLMSGALEHLSERVLRIGTLGNVLAGVSHQTSFTTPEATETQPLLRKAIDEGARAAVMEVSSIGLDQRRVDGIAFHAGIFMNLTQDHLDYHATMGAYREAKARLFRELLRPPGGRPRALVWGDDPSASQLDVPEDTWCFGYAPGSEIRLVSVEGHRGGMRVSLETPDGDVTIDSTMVGAFNALNLAAALGGLLCLDVPLVDAVKGLESVRAVPGRMERVGDGSGPLVLVDYAHTPDALERALTCAREVGGSRLTVVVGCGGDRDRDKRPKMGEIAGRLADRVILTSDNPRGEEPAAILEQMEAGIERDAREARVEIMTDRSAAIAHAIARSGVGDTVLVAGKGHETYQEIKGVRHPFDDREHARRALELR